MDKKIAIIYTTFLRDKLVTITLKSILPFLSKDIFLFVGDQGRDSEEPISASVLLSFAEIPEALWINLPFDCGVSYARNYLIKQAAEMGFKYCLLTADSIEFIPETITNLDKGIQFLENNPDIGILGFDLKDRVPWEFFLDIQDCKFILTKNDWADSLDEKTGLRIKHCDICRQFFLAQIDTILKVKWDEQFKTGEHEDFFWRYKQAGYKVAWTPDISGQYISSKPPEYLKFRNRQYGEFRQLLFKKHNLNDWVEYR